MYVVMNRLPLARPIDYELIAKIESDFIPGARKLAGFRSLQLIRSSDNEAVFVAHFDDLDSLERTREEYAAPWFAEHVQDYLAGPPQRTVGKLIAGGPE